MKLWIKVAVSAGLLTALFLLLPWHQVGMRYCASRRSSGRVCCLASCLGTRSA
jgi:hypothetical protein